MYIPQCVSLLQSDVKALLNTFIVIIQCSSKESTPKTLTCSQGCLVKAGLVIISHVCRHLFNGQRRASTLTGQLKSFVKCCSGSVSECSTAEKWG